MSNDQNLTQYEIDLIRNIFKGFKEGFWVAIIMLIGLIVYSIIT